MELTPNERELATRFSAHEVQCEERWKTVFARLEIMENKMDRLHSLSLTATGTVIIFLAGIILTLLNG
jgi:ATP-dependent protease HslVU (ClpYQ) peptidase subunit